MPRAIFFFLSHSSPRTRDLPVCKRVKLTDEQLWYFRAMAWPWLSKAVVITPLGLVGSFAFACLAVPSGVGSLLSPCFAEGPARTQSDTKLRKSGAANPHVRVASSSSASETQGQISCRIRVVAMPLVKRQNIVCKILVERVFLVAVDRSYLCVCDNSV